MTSGDGHIAPAALAGAPSPQPEGERPDVQLLILAEMQKQTKILEGNRALLHRILLGDLDQLDMTDVTLALGCSDRKVRELIQDNELPMYQLANGRGPWRIGRDLFRTVLRRWQDTR